MQSTISKRFTARVGFYFKQLTGNDLSSEFEADTLEKNIAGFAQDRSSAKSVSRALCAAKNSQDPSICRKKLDKNAKQTIADRTPRGKYAEMADRYPLSFDDWTDRNKSDYFSLKPYERKSLGVEIANRNHVQKWPIGSTFGVRRDNGRFEKGIIRRYFTESNGSGKFDSVLLEFKDKSTGAYYFSQLVDV